MDTVIIRDFFNLFFAYFRGTENPYHFYSNVNDLFLRAYNYGCDAGAADAYTEMREQNNTVLHNALILLTKYNPDVQAYLDRETPQIINAIKILRSLTGCDLREAKDAVEYYQRTKEDPAITSRACEDCEAPAGQPCYMGCPNLN